MPRHCRIDPMSRKFKTVPFAKPDITRRDRHAVDRVLKSGWITTAGVCARFEDSFKNFLNVPYAFAVSSATAGLHLALLSQDIGEGDIVIVPTMTFAATAEAVLYCGATPALADIEPDTLNIAPAALARTIEKYGPRVKAVIPVHHSGRSCKMDEILEICRPKNIKVIEDAAHSFPGTCRNRYQGTLGDIGVYSFYATKTMTTGEGGMVVTSDPKAADFIRKARLHGIDRDVWNRYSSPDAPPTYDVVCRGYKYNLTDTAAALGLSQMKRVLSMKESRKKIALLYTKEFSDLPGISLLPFDSESSFHLYIVRVGRKKRDEVYAALKAAGICCSVHYRPLHLMSFFRTVTAETEKELPEATSAYGEILSLPLFSAMSRKEIKYVIAVFKRTVYNIFK